MAKGKGRHEKRTGPAAAWGMGLLWAVFAAAAAYMAWNLTVGFHLGDEGIALVDAWRMTRGDAPHGDFFEIVPPFSFLPTALVFRVFGASLQAARGLSLVYGLLLILLTDRLLARYAPQAVPRALVAGLLIPFGVFYWPMPSHHWVALLLQLAAALALLSALEGGRSRLLSALCGGLSAAAAFSLQDQGLYFAAALCAGVFPWIRDRALRRRVFACWCLGAAAASSALLAWILSRAPLGEFLYQVLRFPMARYGELEGNRPSLLSGWGESLRILTEATFLGAPAHNASLFALTVLINLLPFLALAAGIAAYRGRWDRPERLGILAALAAASLGTAAHRWTLLSLVWAAPPLLVWAALPLARAGGSAAPWVRRWAAAVQALAALLTAVFCIAYCIRTAPGNCAEVTSRAGRIRSVDRLEAHHLQETLDAIEEWVPPEAPLFCKKYLPLIGFMARRPNPTRYNIFLYPEYNTEEQLREVIESLESTPDAFVLVPMTREPDALDRHIAYHYRLVWKGGRTLLFAPAGAGKAPDGGAAPPEGGEAAAGAPAP